MCITPVESEIVTDTPPLYLQISMKTMRIQQKIDPNKYVTEKRTRRVRKI